MQTLTLALKNRGHEGDPLPAVYKPLEDRGAKIRRGQLTLIAAAPGGGKSLMATDLAMSLGLPTVYFSADSDRGSVGMRALSIADGVTTSDAERMLSDGLTGSLPQKTQNIWFVFDPSPSPRDISDEVDMFAVVSGSYPALIVVDNLMDVNSGVEAKDGHDAVLDFCKRLARRTGAAVVVLCHVVGAFTNGDSIIPRSGLMLKIDKRPRLILTLYKAAPNQMGVCVVKNSSGPADANGQDVRVLLPVMWERGWIGHG